MGVNYYVEADPCEECGHVPEPVHIGKSSSGWVFMLHVYPTHGINTWVDWLDHLQGRTIRDEYKNKVPLHDFIRIVTDRHRYGWEDSPEGYADWAEFHAKNNSMIGPNNLLRGKRSQWCVGHGEGTYDYYIGDFS